MAAAATEDVVDIEDREEFPRRRVQCHCPFGCTLEKVDDNGYCEHLVGFTNSPRAGGTPRVGALVDEIVLDEQMGVRRVNGRHARKLEFTRFGEPHKNPPPSQEKVKKGDALVNIEVEQLPITGGKVTAQIWVSWRVYRGKSGEVARPATPQHVVKIAS